MSAVIAAATPASIDTDERIARAWQALRRVEDPEIPSVSIVDLGLIRFINEGSRLEVGLSPTYVGCPATEVIQQSVEAALDEANIGEYAVAIVLSPAWTSDWISEEGRRKLARQGIVPPEQGAATLREVLRTARPLACPRCQSQDTETISEFGSTPCKALHRCRACLEPFEYFKCI